MYYEVYVKKVRTSSNTVCVEANGVEEAKVKGLRRAKQQNVWIVEGSDFIAEDASEITKDEYDKFYK